ncbi:hypothetical protein FA014_18170, partial [Cellulomonas hominis]
MSTRRTPLTLSALATTALLLAGCTGGDDVASGTPAGTPAGTPPATTAPPTADPAGGAQQPGHPAP